MVAIASTTTLEAPTEVLRKDYQQPLLDSSDLSLRVVFVKDLLDSGGEAYHWHL